MAKQNFLAGGYYGKLGDTVGQRWKNIRTIRSYVIPQNPRTPLQQANRKSFGGVVPYAQLGNSANFGSPAFDLSANTQWAYRMQQGTELQRGGEQGLNLIPLYPKNFIIPHIVSSVTITEIIPNTSITFQISGDIPEGKKSYSIFLMFADGARANEIVLLNGKTTNAQPTVFTCACPDTSEIDTATVYARVCSRDDERIETITASAQILCDKELANDFDPQLTLVSKSVNTDGTITLLLSTPNAYTENTVGSFAGGYYKNSGKAIQKMGTDWNDWAQSLTPTITYENVNGNAGFRVVFNLATYQKTCASWQLDFDIQVYYTNFATQGKDPFTGMTSLRTNAEWINTQPNYTFTIGALKRASGAEGYASFYFDLQANRPSQTFSPTVSKVSVTGTIFKKEDYKIYHGGWTNEQDQNGKTQWQNFSASVDWTAKELCIKVQDYNARINGKYNITNFVVNLTATKLFDDNTLATDVNTNITLAQFPQFLQEPVPANWIDSFSSLNRSGNWQREYEGCYHAECNNPFTLRGHGICANGNYSSSIMVNHTSGTFTVNGVQYDRDDEDLLVNIWLPNTIADASKSTLWAEQTVADAPVSALNLRTYFYMEYGAVFSEDYTIREVVDVESTFEKTINATL